MYRQGNCLWGPWDVLCATPVQPNAFRKSFLSASFLGENPMRRYLIVAAVVLGGSLVADGAFAQGRVGGTTANQGFQVSGGRTGGLGEQGSFGVGTAGQVDTNARYMRDNRQGTFVGADASDADFVGNASGTNAGQSSRSFRRGGGGATNVNQGGRGRGRQRNEVRIVLQLGFTPPARSAATAHRSPDAVAARMSERMNRSNWIQNRSELDVSIEDRTATLRGVVSTEHDRVLAERLALLEGGVRKVENLLEVQPTSPNSQDAPGLLKP